MVLVWVWSLLDELSRYVFSHNLVVPKNNHLFWEMAMVVDVKAAPDPGSMSLSLMVMLDEMVTYLWFHKLVSSTNTIRYKTLRSQRPLRDHNVGIVAGYHWLMDQHVQYVAYCLYQQCAWASRIFPPYYPTCVNISFVITRQFLTVCCRIFRM